MEHPPLNALRQPLDNGRLANTGIADEHGIVLRPADENFNHPIHFGPSTDYWIEVTALGGARHVMAVLRERALRPPTPAGDGSAPATTNTAGPVRRLDAPANRPKVETGLAQALAGQPAMVGQYAQEQMLGADEPYPGAFRFKRGGAQRVTAARTQRSSAGGVIAAGTQGCHHCPPQLQHVNVSFTQNARSRRLRRGQDRQQQVIGTHA